jgi:hypothetical protein
MKARLTHNKLKFIKSYDAQVSSSLAQTTKLIRDKWKSTCVDSLQRPRIAYVPDCITTLMNEEISRHVQYTQDRTAKRRRVEQTLSGLDWIRVFYEDWCYPLCRVTVLFCLETGVIQRLLCILDTRDSTHNLFLGRSYRSPRPVEGLSGLQSIFAIEPAPGCSLFLHIFCRLA